MLVPSRLPTHLLQSSPTPPAPGRCTQLLLQKQPAAAQASDTWSAMELGLKAELPQGSSTPATNQWANAGAFPPHWEH